MSLHPSFLVTLLIDRRSISASVLEDIQFARASPYLRKEMEVRGFVLDIRTGALSEVEIDAAASA